jgi:hypothetical protein
MPRFLTQEQLIQGVNYYHQAARAMLGPNATRQERRSYAAKALKEAYPDAPWGVGGAYKDICAATEARP